MNAGLRLDGDCAPCRPARSSTAALRRDGRLDLDTETLPCDSREVVDWLRYDADEGTLWHVQRWPFRPEVQNVRRCRHTDEHGCSDLDVERPRLREAVKLIRRYEARQRAAREREAAVSFAAWLREFAVQTARGMGA